MSALRVLRPRVLRPNLSLRFQLLRRCEAAATNSPSQPPSPAPKKPGFFRRNRRMLWITLAFLGGYSGGAFVFHSIAPPPLPESGSHGDRILMADLNRRIDEDFKVKVLRGKCLGVAKQLKGAQGGWVEAVPAAVEHEEQAVENEQKKRLVETLEGAKGLGVERLFWDRGEHKLVAVLWFGGAVSGWPGVTHGGVIATQLSEKLALVAALAEETESLSVRAAAAPQRLPGTGNHAKMPLPSTVPDEPAQLSLSYVKPTYANDFYVIRVAPAAPIDEDPPHIVPSEPAGGHEYEATLETLDARICAKAKARFNSSSRVQRVEGQVKEAVGENYGKFKEWMWPSRQQSST